MASASRTVFARALRTATPHISTPARRSLSNVAARPLPKAPKTARNARFNSSQAGGEKKGGNGLLYAAAGLVGISGAAYFTVPHDQLATHLPFLAGVLDTKGGKNWVPDYADYQKVYNDIAAILEDDPDYDDGSFAPVLVRLGWHASGTYDKVSKTGGSNGATMRFAPESEHGANAGLLVARDVLEKVKVKHPWISYSDLWTLAAVAAIQEIGGPVIPWRPGRKDADLATACTPDGRLPDATKTQDHIRDIFYRMGFDDREIVALLGAHAIGRCHVTRSGFDGPWTFSPTVFTNAFYQLLLDEKWQYKKWNGPQQFEDKKTKSLMMLPSDMALVKDKEFRKHVERYAKDEKVFFDEFSESFGKLLELGVPFVTEGRYTFKKIEEQEQK